MKKIITFVFLILVTLVAFGQAPQEFFKSYRLSNSLRERSQSVLELQNGYILDVGESSNCSGVSTCYNAAALIWFDRNGTKIRSKKIGNATGFYGIQASESADGSLIVHGNFTDDLMFMKTDSIGNVLWSKGVDADNYLYGLDMAKVDSMYFVGGTLDFDSSMIYSFTQSGNFRWLKKPETAHGCQIRSIAECNGHIYGIAKLTETDNYQNATCIFEMDVNGNVLNSKIITPSFGGYTRDPAYRICKTSDGNLVATFAVPDADYYIIKMTPSFDILWSMNMNATPKFGSGYHDGIVADNEGGVWIASHTQYSTAVTFVHIGGDGTLLDENNYANGELIEFSGMEYTNDCNLILSGYRRDGGIVHRHWLAALGMDGRIDCLDSLYIVTVSNATLGMDPYTMTFVNRNVTVSSTTMISEEGVYEEENHCIAVADVCTGNAVNGLLNAVDVFVYPNPASDMLYIDAGIHKVTKLELYDINGRLLLRRYDALKSLSLGGFDIGVYLLKIFTSENATVKRIVKL